MRIITIPVQTLTRAAFEPYGVLLERRGTIEIDVNGGTPAMTGATSEHRPFRFSHLARHLRTMQMFSPLAGTRTIVAVARSNDFDKRDAPRLETVTAFLMDGKLPYALHRGTWHTPPFALDEWASYTVVDRAGTLEDDYEIYDFAHKDDVRFELSLEAIS